MNGWGYCIKKMIGDLLWGFCISSGLEVSLIRLWEGHSLLQQVTTEYCGWKYDIQVGNEPYMQMRGLESKQW